MNVVRPSTFRGNNDRAGSGLPHPVSEREVEEWGIIRNSQGLGDSFGLYQGFLLSLVLKGAIYVAHTSNLYCKSEIAKISNLRLDSKSCWCDSQ